MSNLGRTPVPHDAADELQALREHVSELEHQIMDLDRLQDTVRRNSKVFEALLTASQAGIVLTTPDAEIIQIVNSILGYGRETVLGVSLYDLIHPDDHAAMEACYVQVVEDRIPQAHFHLRIRRADHSMSWVEGTVTDMLDNRDVLAIVINYRDVSRLREAQVSRLEFAAVVEHAPFTVFSKDLGGDIRSWNAGAERLFGYQAREIIGQHISKLVPPELQLEEIELRTVVTQEGTCRGPLRTVRLHKNGANIAVELTLVPMIQDGIVVEWYTVQ